MKCVASVLLVSILAAPAAALTTGEIRSRVRSAGTGLAAITRRLALARLAGATTPRRRGRGAGPPVKRLDGSGPSSPAARPRSTPTSPSSIGTDRHEPPGRRPRR